MNGKERKKHNERGKKKGIRNKNKNVKAGRTYLSTNGKIQRQNKERNKDRNLQNNIGIDETEGLF